MQIVTPSEESVVGSETCRHSELPSELLGTADALRGRDLQDLEWSEQLCSAINKLNL